MLFHTGLFACLQGNLNNFVSKVSCQQACIAGTTTPKEAASTGQVAIPTPSDLVFLATALTTKSWITLDATSVGFLLPLLSALITLATKHLCS